MWTAKKLSYVTEKYTFRDIHDDHTIYVEFERSSGTKFDIDADCSSGGSISPSGTIRVTRGHDRTFTFDPIPGMRSPPSMLTAASCPTRMTNTPSTTSTMTTLSMWSLSAATRPGTRLRRTAVLAVPSLPPAMFGSARGSSKTFTFKPYSGYEIAAVYVDGDKVSGTPSSYRFSNVRDDHHYLRGVDRTGSNKFEIEADASSAAASLPPAHPL